MRRILHIVIDDVPNIERFVSSCKQYPADEQVLRVKMFITKSLKVALSSDNAHLTQRDKEKIRRLYHIHRDPEETILLSECLTNGYGSCYEFHILGKVVFEKLGIASVLHVGTRKVEPAKYVYLDICIDEEWRIFDPYAETYLRNVGIPGKFFHPEYYRLSLAVDKPI